MVYLQTQSYHRRTATSFSGGSSASLWMGTYLCGTSPSRYLCVCTSVEQESLDNPGLQKKALQMWEPKYTFLLAGQGGAAPSNVNKAASKDRHWACLQCRPPAPEGLHRCSSSPWQPLCEHHCNRTALTGTKQSHLMMPDTLNSAITAPMTS